MVTIRNVIVILFIFCVVDSLDGRFQFSYENYNLFFRVMCINKNAKATNKVTKQYIPASGYRYL